METESDNDDICDPTQRQESKYKHLHSFVLEKVHKDHKHETGWQYLGDMVRATVVVQSLYELWDAYKWFKEAGIVEIIKIKDKLTSDIKNITISYNFDNKIIGEI